MSSCVCGYITLLAYHKTHHQEISINETEDERERESGLRISVDEFSDRCDPFEEETTQELPSIPTLSSSTSWSIWWLLRKLSSVILSVAPISSLKGTPIYSSSKSETNANN